MSLRVLQFPSPESARTIRLQAIPEAWAESYESSRDMGFLRSWLADDSAPQRAADRVNWGPISGLALSLIVSAGFWTGVALIIERILR
jgi:hypothetical protein